MRTSQSYQFARQVQEQTTTLLLRLFRPRDYSKRCPAWVLLSSLVLAAASRLSLAAVAALWRRAPSRETLRQALFATLPQYAELRRHLARVCRASWPRRWQRRRGRRGPLAIDLHEIPYFKRHKTPPAHVRKGKYRPGTAYGHYYATASLLRKGQYFVVATTPYDPDEDLAEVVRRLLRQATANGFAPRYVLLDRGFWSCAVFRYLQRAGYPFLTPVVARGKKATAPDGPTGTRRFFAGCKTGWYTYRLSDRRGKETVNLTIAVHRRNWAGAHGKHGRYAWAYALWRMDLATVTWVHQSYRRRFRIESSYRLVEAARGRTSSRDEGWRLWYIVVAIVLLNTWLEVRRTLSRSRTPEASEWSWWNRLLLALVYILLVGAATEAQSTTTRKPPQQQ